MPQRRKGMAPRKNIPQKADFIEIMGYNTDGKIQARLWERIFPEVKKIKFFVTKIFSQMIHDRVSWEPGHPRHESDWFAAERVLFQEYGSDGFLGITVGSFLLEATRIIYLWDPKRLNILDKFLVVKEENFFVSGKKFLNYLNEIALKGGGIWLIFQMASEKAEIDFVSVERLVWLELDELFRSKESEGHQWFSI